MGSIGMITMTVDTPSQTAHFKDTVLSFIPAGAGTSGISLRFRTINDFGGNLYLDQIQVKPTVSVRESVLATGWQTYPNPAQEWVEVLFNEPTSAVENLSILAIDGKEVKQFIIPAGNVRVRLPLNGISPGLYIIKNQKGQSTKLVVR
jgi:hypothetical protein